MSFTNHPVFKHPDDSATVWRYMDFPRFISLLTKKSLFFCRLSHLENDPWEGHYPSLQFLPEFAAEVAKEHGWSLEQTIETGELLRKDVEKRRHKNAVSCWSLGLHENGALWKNFSAQVAIKSTFGRLKKAIPGHDIHSGLYAGTVTYLDFSSERIPIDNGYWPVVHKRAPFSYENELRLVISDSKFPPDGIQILGHPNLKIPGFSHPAGHEVAVNLEVLISEVVVSPYEPLWMSELVQTIAVQHGLQFRVSNSTLLTRPA